MSLNEHKEKLSVKIDEKKVNLEKRKAEAKINHEERKLALKAKYTDKRIAAHIEKAIKIVDRSEKDAEKEINKLLDAVDSEIEADEKPIELIIFKAQNKLIEIVLKFQLKIQKAKIDLINNIEKDMERVADLVSIEEDLEDFKAEMDEVSALLDERVSIEKDTLNLKS